MSLNGTLPTNHHSPANHHTPGAPISVVVVSGNPRPGSRTLTVAEAVGSRIRTALTGPVLHQTVEVADLGPEIFAAERPRTSGALATISHADVLVVATPVYKASYTGLLKLFLDQLPPNALQGAIAVPVVVSAAPSHGLVGEAYLRPLLVELGATVPTRAFAVTEAQLNDLDDVVQGWWAGASAPLLHSVRVVAGS